MTKKVLIGGAAVLLIVAVALVGYSMVQKNEDPSSKNTPSKNKQIEVEAAKTKNASLCDTIYGESYNFGPTDGQYTISESSARKQCRQNIIDNITPSEFGG